MSTKNILKVKKALGKYNYWRKSLGMPSIPKRKTSTSSQCQVACHSDPCSAEPSCESD